MVLEGFDALMWSRQLRKSMAFCCVWVVRCSQQLTMGRGKPMAIDRLITLDQNNKANVA
jgi:hypothetical protein